MRPAILIPTGRRALPLPKVMLRASHQVPRTRLVIQLLLEARFPLDRQVVVLLEGMLGREVQV